MNSLIKRTNRLIDLMEQPRRLIVKTAILLIPSFILPWWLFLGWVGFIIVTRKKHGRTSL